MDEDEDDLLGMVPAAFAEIVPKRLAPELKAWTFETLKGSAVVVRANGFIYRGTLIGADEHELYLRGDLRYIVLPLSTVTDVRPEHDK